jgi:hypothetical protein
MDLIALLAIAYFTWRSAPPVAAPVASPALPAASTYVPETQYIAPVIGAEVLRNYLMYESEPVDVSVEEQKLGIQRFALKLRDDGTHRFPKTQEEDDATAFRAVQMLNDNGYVVLAPAGVWGEGQPWSEANAMFAAVHKDAAPAAIAGLAGRGRPWAVLVRTPGSLSNYDGAAWEDILKTLEAKDVA